MANYLYEMHLQAIVVAVFIILDRIFGNLIQWTSIYNKVGITNDILHPSNSKMSRKEPQYNEIWLEWTYFTSRFVYQVSAVPCFPAGEFHRGNHPLAWIWMSNIGIHSTTHCNSIPIIRHLCNLCILKYLPSYCFVTLTYKIGEKLYWFFCSKEDFTLKLYISI